MELSEASHCLQVRKTVCVVLRDWSSFPFRACPFAEAFPASSIGPGYTSVWHRDPGGTWTFYSEASGELVAQTLTLRLMGTAAWLILGTGRIN